MGASGNKARLAAPGDSALAPQQRAIRAAFGMHGSRDRVSHGYSLPERLGGRLGW
jgi:hypothetical protein